MTISSQPDVTSPDAWPDLAAATRAVVVAIETFRQLEALASTFGIQVPQPVSSQLIIARRSLDTLSNLSPLVAWVAEHRPRHDDLDATVDCSQRACSGNDRGIGYVSGELKVLHLKRWRQAGLLRE